jgi:hypothetical protein
VAAVRLDPVGLGLSERTSAFIPLVDDLSRSWLLAKHRFWRLTFCVASASAPTVRDLQCDGGRVILTDLGSTNGTPVHGRPLHNAHERRTGDVISSRSSLCTDECHHMPPALSTRGSTPHLSCRNG